MKLKVITGLVVTLLVGGLVMFKPHQLMNSWVTACGTHIARNHQAADEFRVRLDAWLLENKFVPVDPPSDVHMTTGLQQAGDSHSWYVGSYEGYKPVYILLSSDERSDVGAGWTDFHLYTSWFARGSDSYLSEANAASEKLTVELYLFAKKGSAGTE